MLAFLKQHPFAVEAYFKRSTVLTFTVEKELFQPMLPECLQLDTFQDRYGFLAMAMVQTEHLRPKGWPKFMGSDFFLIGYRLFVKYVDNNGKRLRGLYILNSQTNKKSMELRGNIFTQYNYSTIDIEQQSLARGYKVQSNAAGFEVEWQHFNDELAAKMPLGSPFENWADARKFSGPLPFTFTYLAPTKEVLIIEGVRSNWKPQPIDVLRYQVPYLQELGLGEAHLASAFMVENIPYYWKKGRKEIWRG